ncbi:MAG TPA: ABATE domain-containing protein [Geminicoccaceae bacterium]|nr:ABATE domain-containing protein [Geminicoccaceae bacterium]
MSSSPRAGCLPRIGGALALDFCNSTTGRGTDRFVEHLFDHEDLLRWAVFNELLPIEAAAKLAARTPSREREAAFAAAMRLRGLLNRIFDALARGEPADAGSLAEVRDRAKEEWRSAALVRAGSGYAWRFTPPDAHPDALLGPIVRSAVEVLIGRDLARLKVCPGQHCGWVFLDTTKNANRVWCEMEVCGTRAKLRRRAQTRREAGGRRATT